MLNRRLVILLMCLLTVFPLQALANPVDEWTLATVPSLEYVSASGNTHTVRIVTTNKADTEMNIESSNDGFKYQLYRDWMSYSNGDTFSFLLKEGETIYLRIKARNAKGIETAFSQPLRIENGFTKPPKPVTRGQETGDDFVSIDFEPPTGNSVYWIHRLDKSSPEKVTSFPFRDNTVLPAREYTYEFWIDNNGVISEKNRITIWTKPQKPLVRVKETTANQVILEVDTLNNPGNILIEAQDVDSKTLFIEGKQVKATDLIPQTEYKFRVRLKSENDEYTPWVEVSTTTTNSPSRGSSGSSPDQSELERQFKEEAAKIITDLIYKADGELNSGTTWIELQLSNPTSYRVQATVDGKSKILSTQPIKFDGLMDNQEYKVEISISEGNFSFIETISKNTPNRTPPSVQKAFYDSHKNQLVVEVESVSGIKQ